MIEENGVILQFVIIIFLYVFFLFLTALNLFVATIANDFPLSSSV